MVQKPLIRGLTKFNDKDIVPDMNTVRYAEAYFYYYYEFSHCSADSIANKQ